MMGSMTTTSPATSYRVHQASRLHRPHCPHCPPDLHLGTTTRAGQDDLGPSDGPGDGWRARWRR